VLACANALAAEQALEFGLGRAVEAVGGFDEAASGP